MSRWPDPQLQVSENYSDFTTSHDEIAHLFFNILYWFSVNPPAPIPCPIRGRYIFTQQGPESELYRTRIRGVTVRPRHMIPCRHYTTEWKSCDEDPFTIKIDAEYCETVDHTGKPIGEYGTSGYPSKRKIFVEHLYNVGPTSKTLCRRCTKVVQMCEADVFAFDLVFCVVLFFRHGGLGDDLCGSLGRGLELLPHNLWPGRCHLHLSLLGRSLFHPFHSLYCRAKPKGSICLLYK